MIRKKIHSFYYQFAVALMANQTNPKLEQSSRIQNQHLTGVKVQRASGTKRSINNNTIVNDGVFDSSFLTLKQRNTEVVEQIPLSIIEDHTKEGRWFDVNIPRIDMAQSFVKVANQAAIVSGEEFEFIFRYNQKIIQEAS